jgi:hypothetical protein
LPARQRLIKIEESPQSGGDFLNFTFCILIFHKILRSRQQINKKGRSPSLVGGVGVLKEEDNCVDLSQ